MHNDAGDHALLRRCQLCREQKQIGMLPCLLFPVVKHFALYPRPHACVSLDFHPDPLPSLTYDHMVRTPTIIGGLMCCVPSHLCRVLHRDPR